MSDSTCDKYGWVCDYCRSSDLAACQEPVVTQFCKACEAPTTADPDPIEGTATLSSRYFWVIDCDTCVAPTDPTGIFDTGSAGYIYEPSTTSTTCPTSTASMHYQGTHAFQVCPDSKAFASHVMYNATTGAPQGAIYGVLQGKKSDATVRGSSLQFAQCSGNRHYTVQTSPLPSGQLAWSIGCREKPTPTEGMVCRTMPESSQHGLNEHSYHAWWPTTCSSGGGTAVTLVDSGWPGFIQDRAYKNQVNVAGSGTFQHHSSVIQFDEKGGGTICLSADLASNLDEHAEQAMCRPAFADRWF